jgi:hypothetical protein
MQDFRRGLARCELVPASEEDTNKQLTPAGGVTFVMEEALHSFASVLALATRSSVVDRPLSTIETPPERCFRYDVSAEGREFGIGREDSIATDLAG